MQDGHKGDIGWRPTGFLYRRPREAPTRLEITDLSKHTAHIKQMAISYGASDVGCCELNRQWVYSSHWKGCKRSPLSLPEGVKHAVVFAIAMDDDMGILAFSQLAATAACIAELIQRMGYTAIPSVNDTALSVPMAIDAGLGEQGRLGLLVHPRFGPRVLIGKVLTDMPLQPDRPIQFGVYEFCQACKQCAASCPAHCISFADELDEKNPTVSENPGVVKWQVNQERCRANGWVPAGNNCTICISVCPLRKGNGTT